MQRAADAATVATEERIYVRDFLKATDNLQPEHTAVATSVNSAVVIARVLRRAGFA